MSNMDDNWTPNMSKYAGEYEGYYYDEVDGCYYEGERDDVYMQQKIQNAKSQKTETNATNNNIVDSINKTWKSSDINQFKLEFEPFFIEKLEKIKKEKGRDATVDEMLEGLEDDQKRKLTESIFKWKSDISKIIQANRSINEGNTLDEIKF